MVYNFKQRVKEGKTEVFDPIRKKWLLQTPEERVRQLFILYLLNVKQIPESHISVEKAITVNGLTKRYDLVVFNLERKPEIVIECKAPEVAITQTVVEQAGRYNKTLHARILGVTNGTTHYFFTIDFDTEEITPITF
ncbi:MAG: type I restriction enzyme HsdR N-terminal domain-containing protein [Bacteroidales bacterium]|nr:type I restriction enzyme HsdR N-terminal domain-containing protein [Bacteroidales bacterium]